MLTPFLFSTSPHSDPEHKLGCDFLSELANPAFLSKSFNGVHGNYLAKIYSVLNRGLIWWCSELWNIYSFFQAIKLCRSWFLCMRSFVDARSYNWLRLCCACPLIGQLIVSCLSQTEYKQLEDADTYEPTPVDDYDNPCHPVGLPSPSLISAEVSSLHSIVLGAIHDVEHPCQLDEESVECDSHQLLESVVPSDDPVSTLDAEPVACDESCDSEETLATVVSNDDHVHCPSTVYVERPSRVSKRLPMRLIRALTEDDDEMFQTKRVKFHTVSC